MLLTVRLGPKEEKVVRGMRRAKVNVSALVRKAIVEAAKEPEIRTGKDAARALRRIFDELPDDETPRLRLPASDDRHAQAAYIRKKLRSR